MKGREKSAMVFNYVWRDIPLTAHGGRGGQAGDAEGDAEDRDN